MVITLTHITDYLLAQSVQIALLVVVIAAVNLALRNKSAHVRYLLWLIVLAKCLAPPLLTVPLAILPPQKKVEPAPISLPAETFSLPRENMDVTMAEASDVRSAPLEMARPLTVEHRRPSLSAREWLGIGWIIGAGAFLMFNLLRALRAGLWLWRHRERLPARLRNDIEGLFADHGVKRVPDIWLVEGFSQPFVWGLWRGSIYLPVDFLKINKPEYQRSVLSHELSHLLRFDAAVNLLQVIAQGIFWFHPLVWWANRKIRTEREKCCDEMAVARLNTSPKEYSTAILETLASKHEPIRPVPSLAVAGPVKNIEERIKTMLRPGKTFHKHPSVVAATIVSLLALLTVPTALVLSARAEETKTVSGNEETRSKSLQEAVVAGDIEQVKLLLSTGTAINAKDQGGRTPLHNAASKGYTEIAKLLIAKGADVNARDEDDWTPLHYAAKNGHKEVAEVLIAKGADINARDRWLGWTPIHRAARNGHKEIVELLLVNGVDVNSGNWFDKTAAEYAMDVNRNEIVELLISKGADISPLHFALHMKDRAKARSLIEGGANVNKRTRYGTAPLHMAAGAGLKDIAELLIDKGADVNAADNRGRTPLHDAAEKGHKEIVELLIAKGADVNAGARWNLSAAQFAMRGNHNEIVELLISKGADISPLHFALHMRDRAKAKSLIEGGADVNKRTPYGTSPLHLAAGAGLKDIAVLLIEKGANVNTKDNWSWTPLHSAACGHKDIVELLIAKGADVNSRDGDGHTPLWYAQEGGYKDIVGLLVASGGDVNSSAGNWTSLHTAAEQGNKDMAELLIAKGVNVNAQDWSGRTAMHLAARKGHKEIVELLLANGAHVNSGTKFNQTPAELAMEENHSEIVELLVSKGADISPLHFAIYIKDRGKAKRLIEDGADVNKRTQYGTTPLHMAAGASLKDVAVLLIEKGANVNTRDNWNWTPLHSAAEKGYKDMAELLIAKGADVNARDSAGRTALWYAERKGFTEIVELLRKHGPE